MADQRITDLTGLTGAGTATTDVLPIVDVSDTTMAASGTTKKIAISDLAVGLGVLTSAQHEAVLQLIHFIDEGPAEGFTTGATKTVTGGAFPTNIVWKRADTTKLVEQNITWTGILPTTVEWKVYAANGTSVLATVTDTISYSGPFETGRSRSIA